MSTIELPQPGWRVPLRRRSRALFSWDIEDLLTDYTLNARTGQVAAFVRNALAPSVHDGLTLVRNTPAFYYPRIGSYTLGGVKEPALCIEQSHKNCAIRSEDFSTGWTLIGTPTRVAGALTWGDLNMDLIGDDTAATLEGYSQVVTLAFDGKHGIGLYISQGTSTSSVIRLRDTTAGADRLLATITWSSGVPVVTMTTGVTLGTVSLGPNSSGQTVFRVMVQTTSGLLKANNNQLEIYPATTSGLAIANQGTIAVGGVHVGDDGAPGDYIETAGAALATTADALTWPINFERQALTMYVRYFTNRGGYGAATNGQSIILLGSTIAAGAPPSINLGDDGNLNGQLLAIHNTTSPVNSGSSQVILPYDLVEARVTIAADGSIGLGVAVNGAAEVVATTSGATAMGTAWHDNIVAPVNGAFTRILVLPGVRTMTECRSAT